MQMEKVLLLKCRVVEIPSENGKENACLCVQCTSLVNATFKFVCVVCSKSSCV